jgi:plasmid maintenance system antidote protein VapI
VPRTRIERIAEEKTGISGDTAIRLGLALGTTPNFWMNLQTRFEIETARARLPAEIAAQIIRVNAPSEEGTRRSRAKPHHAA